MTTPAAVSGISRSDRRCRIVSRFWRGVDLGDDSVDTPQGVLKALGRDGADIERATVFDAIRDAWGAGPGFLFTPVAQAAITWALRHIALHDPTHGCPCSGRYDEQAVTLLIAGIAHSVRSGDLASTVKQDKVVTGAEPEPDTGYVPEAWEIEIIGGLYYLGYSGASTKPIADCWSMWYSHRLEAHSRPALPGFLALAGGDHLDEARVDEGIATMMRSMLTRQIDGTLAVVDDLDAVDDRYIMLGRSGLDAHGPGFGCRVEVAVCIQLVAQAQEVYDYPVLDCYNAGWYRFIDTPEDIDRLCDRLWTVGTSCRGGLAVFGALAYGMCGPRHNLAGRLPAPADMNAVCDWPFRYEAKTVLGCDPALSPPAAHVTVPPSAATHTRHMLAAMCDDSDPDRATALLRQWESRIRTAFGSDDAQIVTNTATPMLAALLRIFRYVLLRKHHRDTEQTRRGSAAKGL